MTYIGSTAADLLQAGIDRPKTAAELGLMDGFPPLANRRVTRANWECAPFNRWAFQNVTSIFPAADIRCAGHQLRPRDDARFAISDVILSDGFGLEEMFHRSYSDGLMILKEGRVLLEHYANGMEPHTLHLTASVTKSFIGALAGIKMARQELDPDQTVATCIEELGPSSFADATIRHVLDMTAGTRFSEDYDSPAADIRIKTQCDGWDVRTTPGLPPTIYEYLATLSNDREHGKKWAYRSCLTDLLGWVLERRFESHLSRLLQGEIWSKIGARHDARFALGPVGNCLYDGGILCTLGDLAAFGAALCDEQGPIPRSFVVDTLNGDEDCSLAFSASDRGRQVLPQGHYRNQFWVPETGGSVLMCLGVYGQYLWVNTKSKVVIAKFSSLPHASNTFWMGVHFDLFDRLGKWALQA